MLLVEALDHGLTGSLVLDDAMTRRHTIYFKNGVPAQAHTPSRIAKLETVLREMRVVDEHALQESVERSGRNTILLAQDLVKRGLLCDAQVRHTLAIQLRRRMRALLHLPAESRFAFYLHQNLVPGGRFGFLTPIAPLPLVMAGIILKADELRIDDTLAGLQGAALCLRHDAPIDELGLASDHPVLEALRYPASLSEVFYAAAPDMVRAVLFALTITRSLTIIRESGPPAEEADPPVAPNVESGIRSRASALNIDDSVRWGTRNRD